MPLFDIDLKDRTVSFSIPSAVYSKEAVTIAAHIFTSQTEVLLGEEGKEYSVILRARRAKTAAELERLGGEFLNELLNQEYRFIVGRFNANSANLIVTQALFSARGGEKPLAPEPKPDAAFKAETAKLLKQAREEIARTMPKKIAPQGTPLPPMKEESVA